uniref:Uncharacterized protein n=1 Tax=Crocodylus porosus TaxID=8502 RepID=A0A7M4EPN2_CROPO
TACKSFRPCKILIIVVFDQILIRRCVASAVTTKGLVIPGRTGKVLPGFIAAQETTRKPIVAGARRRTSEVDVNVLKVKTQLVTASGTRETLNRGPEFPVLMARRRIAICNKACFPTVHTS